MWKLSCSHFPPASGSTANRKNSHIKTNLKVSVTGWLSSAPGDLHIAFPTLVSYSKEPKLVLVSAQRQMSRSRSLVSEVFVKNSYQRHLKKLLVLQSARKLSAQARWQIQRWGEACRLWHQDEDSVTQNHHVRKSCISVWTRATCEERTLNVPSSGHWDQRRTPVEKTLWCHLGSCGPAEQNLY